MQADLHIASGKVYSFGAQSILGETLDVAIRDGKVCFIGPKFTGTAARTIDVSGYALSPRFWDVHAHVGDGWGTWGAKYPALANLIGVVFDAGTPPPLTVRAYRNAIVTPASPHYTVGLLVNCSRHGLCSGQVADFWHPSDLAPAMVRNALTENADIVFGTKARVDNDTTAGRLDVSPIIVGVREAREATERLGKPRRFMLHHSSGAGEPPLGYLLDAIGDDGAAHSILTHAFRGVKPDAAAQGTDWGNSILGPDGSVRPAVLRLVGKGMKLDVGHGMAGIAFSVFRIASAAGLWPDFISTDHHALCMSSVKGLLNVMSEMLWLGMPLEKILRAVIENPANTWGMPERAEIVLGSDASFAIWRVEPGSPRFVDGLGEVGIGTEQFVPRFNICHGDVIFEQPQAA